MVRMPLKADGLAAPFLSQTRGRTLTTEGEKSLPYYNVAAVMHAHCLKAFQTGSNPSNVHVSLAALFNYFTEPTIWGSCVRLSHLPGIRQLLHVHLGSFDLSRPGIPKPLLALFAQRLRQERPGWPNSDGPIPTLSGGFG